MRNLLAGAFFVLAAVLAACGGGGGSGVVPGSGSSGPTQAQPNGKTTQATMRFLIPAPSLQAASRHRLYISPNTQSFGVLAIPAGSSETPSPQNMQIFPVATPSPCAAVSGGGYSCTFVVTAPIGSDIFYVAAFATASPGPSAVPLSDFISGTVNVGTNTSGSPLSFSLNSVVNHVQLTVPSPDPVGGNTQIFPAGAASQAYQLGITAYDSAGNVILADPTTSFDTPIALTVSPASAGVSLVLGSSTCTAPVGAAPTKHRRMQFSGGSSTVTVTCAGEMYDVLFGYDGTVALDANDHLIDSFKLSAGKLDFPSPSPGPATVALSSNIQTWQVQLGPNGYTWDNPVLQTMPNGQLVYAFSYGGATPEIGTFDPSTLTLTSPVTLNGISGLTGLTVAPNGTLWIAGGSNGLYCYDSVTSAMSGAPPTLAAAFPSIPNTDPLAPTGIAADSSGNVWYGGFDLNDLASPPPAEYAGSVSSSGGCNVSNATAPYTLSGASNSAPVYVTPLSGGGAAIQTSGGFASNAIYVVPANSPQPMLPAFNGSYAGGIATDDAGTIYGAFCDQSTTCDIESAAQHSATLNVLNWLPPSPSPVGLYPAPYVQSLSAFGPHNGAADRLAYADAAYGALGLVENASTTPMALLANLPNGYWALATTYTTQGGEYVLYEDSSANLNIARALPTTTWSVPSAQVSNFCGVGNAMVSIVERGDSGPFSVTVPGGGTTSTAMPNGDHDYWLQSLPGSTGSFNISVSDSHGRTELVPITSTVANVTCGLRRRHTGKTRGQPHGPRIP